jgi:hypothetical protein
MRRAGSREGPARSLASWPRVERSAHAATVTPTGVPSTTTATAVTVVIQLINTG